MEEELIDRFIASFEKLDEMADFEHINPAVQQFAIGSPDSYGRLRWKPKKVQTDPSQMDLLHAKLPAQLPPLFEQLVLSYRWIEVDLQTFRLLPNPLGTDLSGLLNEMMKDKAIWENLIPAGYIQFGRGADMDYDPVCFDIKSRTKDKDYGVVKIDHEEILCNDRVKVVKELAPSFRLLVLQIIERAAIAG